MKIFLAKLLVPLLGLLLFGISINAQPRAYKAPKFAANWSKPGLHPDHITLNLTADPSTSMSVTWRTNVDVKEGFVEIALATAAPKFWRNAKTIKAKTETMDASAIEQAEVISNYHSVTFTELEPDKLYAYRVGDGSIWSEWIQFRTASGEAKPFSFLYVGDAQNYIMELWSRLIRQGYQKVPDASFIIHAGDLINHAHNDREWHEWFMAGGWIHGMLPSISVPGNHEYRSFNDEEWEQGIRHLSVQWRPQFTLPENGIEGLEETSFYVDYEDTRIIALNTNISQAEQVPWLEKVLAENPKKWAIATFHHPLFSASAGRDNVELRALWRPIFDKYHVDLVLQGHDHSYARGRVAPLGDNVVAGVNTRDLTGTVYVVSVSGGKMYSLRPNGWEDYDEKRDRGAENTQLFQVINVDGDKLSYESYTATGELYDAFDIIKTTEGKPNKFVERKQEAVPARRHNNTIHYADKLPENVASDLKSKYDGYSIDRVVFVDQDGFKGYKVKLEKGSTDINLDIDLEGKILKEEKSE